METMAAVSPYVETRRLRTLGAGSFGSVVLAREPGDGACGRGVDVALKVSRAGGTSRQDILWEAACLRTVAHANVLRLIDVRASTPGGERDPDDLPILVFPPADLDLQTFLGRRPGGVLPPELARRMMRQLAAALAHVHAHNIIHRDVKPENCLIFLASEVHGEFLGPSLALADFGTARRWSGDPRLRLRNKTRAPKREEPMTALVCTCWYRPPELWAATMGELEMDQEYEETTPYGPSLDVWSFGAVVYQVLSGVTLVRRAGNGAEMARAVADVIGAAPAKGPSALTYTRNPRWQSWAPAAMSAVPSRPLPESGAEWDLVRTCLRWDPAARVTMSSGMLCAWFGGRVATPEAAPTSEPEPRADASTLSSTPTAQTPTEIARAWFEPDLSPPKKFASEVKCRCKGHCRVYSHRKSGECNCTELVVGAGYCATCVCVVAGCGRPRLKSDYCSHHKRVLDAAPLRVQLAVAAVPVTPLMMPCDVEDFVATSVILQDDVAMLILVAAIKEPLAVGALVEAWEQLPAQYSGSDLRSAILRALAVADGAPHAAQLTQLHRQGVQRFFGLITTASNLGVIQRAKKTDDVRPEQQAYRLGSMKTLYVVRAPSESLCDKLLEATREEERSLAAPPAAGASKPSALDAGASTPCVLDDLVDYGSRRAKAALRRIGTKSGALPFHAEDASGYCIDWLTRKMVAARLIRQNLHQSDDWSRVDKASLQSMSADSKENLESVPDAWTASEISSFFSGRADWGLFASAFPCLWGEVADELIKNGASDYDRAQAIQLIKSDTFLQVVRTFRETEGIAPHPMVAYELAQKQSEKLALACELALESPRASMPRKKLKA
ncbi:unnamed protein product [Prorocentrum cordatum]|uniref:Protein kinase domain-containing protein n=2 Tax=Prorocentrum cordatum TaxID=2364126 RepID=A0ABN9RXS0_9DINO|nr:unnamed protein product [Polarella glacialis]